MSQVEQPAATNTVQERNPSSAEATNDDKKTTAAAAVSPMSPSSQDSSDIPNPKFKTALCRNFINSTCNRNSGCHFAHGSEELRAVSENSGFFEEVEKAETDYLNKWPSNIPTNYKTTLCKFYEQVGTCKYDQNCNFAHGDQEKRQLPENIQSQLKNSRSSQKHVNNSSGQRNQQQLYMQSYAMEAQYLQSCVMQYLLNQQQTCVKEMCTKLVEDAPQDNYVIKTVKDIQQLADELKIKQALTQIKKLCSNKDSTKKQQEICKDVEKYLQTM